MKIINTYSFKGGEKFLKTKHPKELKEVQDAIKALDATLCLTKESKEKTKKGQVLFSPVDMNNYLKLVCHQKGWTTKAEEGKKRKFVEPRHAFGKGRFREMDGIKNKVGLEIQFGKYAFMGYDIFSKMIIFKNLKYIECGIEIVPSNELVKFMSTGVSSFEQLLVDFEHRGESNIDIPVFVMSIGLTDEEKTKSQTLRELFRTNKKEALLKIKLRKYNGSAPGPK
ncbi:TPA: restriction endonuclease [Candidatus Uhrbacteria bacterium]|uniref:Restriction endonuclease BglII n=2 Tax=Candidatus Uhriibacteriota TaxID=1752732 RepID=A0A0G1SFQ3_9BACT|nr:MAG: Restriction endonuclease BglII [Candidatus Uhrbacteria bacterium GW2011_GWF2_46_218]KKU40913.1 MAG: Restriction endonuclease BglII [Candidatus Uhrbacteria bacterium GW2011_GWE2_46_68]HBK33977.1 restriction endonuclease [Candidatus Uhrbacteria bacterium]HCB19151.1 restriction endonuclease [Candidatus Uhrbacteria bacterium]